MLNSLFLGEGTGDGAQAPDPTFLLDLTINLQKVLDIGPICVYNVYVGWS